MKSIGRRCSVLIVIDELLTSAERTKKKKNRSQT